MKNKLSVQIGLSWNVFYWGLFEYLWYVVLSYILKFIIDFLEIPFLSNFKALHLLGILMIFMTVVNLVGFGDKVSLTEKNERLFSNIGTTIVLTGLIVLTKYVLTL